MHDILSFDAEFGKILQELHLLVCRKQYLESMGGDNSNVIADLCFRGTPIEDLCLDFTLPGYPDYTLKPVDATVYLQPLILFPPPFFLSTDKSNILLNTSGGYQ